MFTSERIDVADDTIPMINDDDNDDVYSIVHKYHPSRHGIVVDVTAANRLPTVPVRRSKFAKLVLSLAKYSCAKLLVPRRR